MDLKGPNSAYSREREATTAKMSIEHLFLHSVWDVFNSSRRTKKIRNMIVVAFSFHNFWRGPGKTHVTKFSSDFIFASDWLKRCHKSFCCFFFLWFVFFLIKTYIIQLSSGKQNWKPDPDCFDTYFFVASSILLNGLYGMFAFASLFPFAVLKGFMVIKLIIIRFIFPLLFINRKPNTWPTKNYLQLNSLHICKNVWMCFAANNIVFMHDNILKTLLWAAREWLNMKKDLVIVITIISRKWKMCSHVMTLKLRGVYGRHQVVCQWFIGVFAWVKSCVCSLQAPALILKWTADIYFLPCAIL